MKAITRAVKEFEEAKRKEQKAEQAASELRLKAKQAIEDADLADAKAIQASINRLEKWECLHEIDPSRRTPDTDENQSDYPFSVLHSRRQNAPCLPPKPERRPRLFLASAKTGVGVEPIFEYIARRVAMRWTYAEALEARIVHTNAAMNNTVRLTAAKPRITSLRERWAVSENSCCGV